MSKRQPYREIRGTEKVVERVRRDLETQLSSYPNANLMLNGVSMRLLLRLTATMGVARIEVRLLGRMNLRLTSSRTGVVGNG